MRAGRRQASGGPNQPPVYMDLASLGALPRYTCGQLYYYPAFNARRDQVPSRFTCLSPPRHPASAC